MRGRTAKETASFTYVGNKYDARDKKEPNLQGRGNEIKKEREGRKGRNVFNGDKETRKVVLDTLCQFTI